MRNFKDTFETSKQLFISAFSICITVPFLRLQVPGTWNVNPKCSTLQKFRLQVPWNVSCQCPLLQKLRLQVLGTWYENFKCLALGKLRLPVSGT